MKGKKTAHECALTANTKRVTFSITVTASGKMLPSMLTFKGATDRQSCQARTYHDCSQYVCHKKAWVDKEIMHKWIALVLIP